MTILGKWIAQKIFHDNVNKLMSLNDEQWDFILRDQDKKIWSGGKYFGIKCSEHEINYAYIKKYVKTGLRESLL